MIGRSGERGFITYPCWQSCNISELMYDILYIYIYIYYIHYHQVYNAYLSTYKQEKAIYKLKEKNKNNFNEKQVQIICTIV